MTVSKTATPVKAAGGKAAATVAVNSNIPKAPPISHYMAFIAGKYDPANPPTDNGAGTGEIPR